ncbi:superoxide dismutase family protein [Luteolibacter sp. AS25]|uniref:superoxide dismutase family protein n=1 Tax=Luteolibacter sp. AS25 TaxID=3135776 RepID=UPI00398A6D98
MKTKHRLNDICKAAGIFGLAVVSLQAMEEGKGMEKIEHTEHSSAELNKLIAVIYPVKDSNVKGTVVFEKVEEGVKVTANVGGLEPNSKHGFHIHEFGDMASADATSAGGHFNPDGHDHALPDKDMRHSGDLGNLEADENGAAKLEITVKGITLDAGKTGILGRGVIIHAKEDDGGQPTGNAGDRIGAGVIGISKDAMEKSEEDM